MSDLRAATPPLLKRLNEETVLEAIRAGAPISRAEISRRAGISKPTVSLALEALREAGLVREAAGIPGRRHYGAVYFEPVDEAALVLGIDLGARFLRGVLGDLSGTVRARLDLELASPDADEALAAIVQLRDSLAGAAALPVELVDQVVVGVPGVVADDGRVQLALNVRHLEERRFGADLQERLGVAVAIENDVNLAALGERRLGVAQDVDDFAFISVGTGLGGGLVLGGELQRGRHGAAAELDYVRAGRPDDIDPCAAALAALTERLAAAGEPTTLTPPYDARAVFAAARGGDAVARAAVAEEARRIALHIVPIAAVTDVELVVLGGGLGANAELLDAVRPLLADWLPYPPRVEISSLGDAAVLTGALAVGLRAALDGVFLRRRGHPELVG